MEEQRVVSDKPEFEGCLLHICKTCQGLSFLPSTGANNAGLAKFREDEMRQGM